jgi:hypothetical protein
MPMLIEYLDHIALQKNRDILFLDFQIKPEGKSESEAHEQLFLDGPKRDEAMEAKIMAWLERENIDYCTAGPVSWSGWITGGPLYLYLDVPMDETNEDYKKLCAYLENADGSMRFQNCQFCYMTLEGCKEKAVTDFDDL